MTWLFLFRLKMIQMTINEMIVQELRFLGLPVFFIKNTTNTKNNFIVFNYSRYEADFYNDESHGYDYVVTLNVYLFDIFDYELESKIATVGYEKVLEAVSDGIKMIAFEKEVRVNER